VANKCKDRRPALPLHALSLRRQAAKRNAPQRSGVPSRATTYRGRPLVLNNQGARIITQSGKFVKSSGLCYNLHIASRPLVPEARGSWLYRRTRQENMLDIALIREQPEQVRDALQILGADRALVDPILALATSKSRVRYGRGSRSDYAAQGWSDRLTRGRPRTGWGDIVRPLRAEGVEST
jgi:hypothetical protein